MAVPAQIRDEFSTWIGRVAEAIVAAVNRISVHRHVRLIETGQNSFTMSMISKPRQAAPPDFQFKLMDDEPGLPLPADWKAALRGSHFEVVLRSSRFLFRPLDLPKRATEFLDGMIRSQIDRLTPWTTSEAIFSWTAPVQTSNERIDLTVIAAPKTKIDPLIRLAEYCGAGSVVLYATPQGSQPSAVGRAAAGGGIKVFEKRMRGSLDVARVRRILAVVLLTAAVSATLSLGIAGIVDGRLDAQQQQLSGKIAERRAALRLKLATPDDSAQGLLVRRKHSTPSSVMVLDALSQILPDNTYVTELRIEKDKLQIVGITQDAPSLIKLLEQSAHFTGATFFAPTTRSADDPGERFHVEAHIKPFFGLGT
jgi:general secretion pathway protein L